jgi:hypothetical protein
MAAPNELSFLPDDYLERKARRRANALCASLSVIVMGASVPRSAEPALKYNFSQWEPTMWATD